MFPHLMLLFLKKGWCFLWQLYHEGINTWDKIQKREPLYCSYFLIWSRSYMEVEQNRLV